MLARQIGKVVENAFSTDDAQALLDAAGGGSSSMSDTPIGGGGGPIGITPQPMNPGGGDGITVKPAGGGVTLAPTGVPNVSLIIPGSGAAANGTLLWVIAGLGGAYLLSGGTGGRVITGALGSTGKRLLLVGGVGALAYFLLKKSATPTVIPASVPSGGGGGQVLVDDPNRAILLSSYVGYPVQLAVIANADAETLRRWVLIAGYWNAGTDPYKYDVNGNPTTVYDNSVGKWWELFAQQNHV